MRAPSTNQPRHGLFRLLLLWLATIIVVVAAFAIYERQRLLGELQSEASILHRLASQRADQHDAHLTSLSALATAGEVTRQDLFMDVAVTLLRFYPRIEAVDLVSLADSAAYLTTRTGLAEDAARLIRAAARGSDGPLVLRPAPGAPGDYLVVKRSPNTDDARFGLALQIETEALLAADSPFWTRPSVTRKLALPDGTVLSGDDRIAGVRFRKVLGSASQPLVFHAGIDPDLRDLMPPARLASIGAATSLLFLAAVLGWRQLARTRQAEARARLSAQDARLAHASRVNALGEMASGMAHELTQPLTAILSQAQAGRHIAARGGADATGPVFDTIASQAKRAAAILDRLRNWTRPRSDAAVRVSVQNAIRGVELLLRPEALRAGVVLSTKLGAEPIPVQADPVELEQILFNLVRNAIEAAADGAAGHVSVSARRADGQAVIEVADTGSGVPPEIRARIFEPFVTGKADGTGLGLALCQRLAERMGGSLVLAEDQPETVFRLSLPRAGTDRKEAAE